MGLQYCIRVDGNIFLPPRFNTFLYVSDHSEMQKNILGSYSCNYVIRRVEEHYLVGIIWMMRTVLPDYILILIIFI